MLEVLLYIIVKMDKNFISYLVSRGISVAQYQAASIGDRGQILSVYEQQKAPGNVQRPKPRILYIQQALAFFFFIRYNFIKYAIFFSFP